MRKPASSKRGKLRLNSRSDSGKGIGRRPGRKRTRSLKRALIFMLAFASGLVVSLRLSEEQRIRALHFVREAKELPFRVFV